MSSLPSPSKSASTTANGYELVEIVCAAAKLGVVEPAAVVLCRIEMLLLAELTTTRSGLPSPSRSPNATCAGLEPTARSTFAANVAVEKPGAVVLIKTETVLLCRFVMRRSGLPSPLISPAATKCGPVPVANVCWAVNETAAAADALSARPPAHASNEIPSFAMLPTRPVNACATTASSISGGHYRAPAAEFGLIRGAGARLHISLRHRAVRAGGIAARP